MIVAAGLSPAWQQIFRVDVFREGDVNRAVEAHQCAAGKVLNAALAIHTLGGDVRVVSILGGETGESIRRDIAASGIDARWVESSTATRVCTTIVDSAGCRSTELVENAPEVSEDELESCRDLFRDGASDACVVLITGSLPDGAPPVFHRDLLEGLTARAVLDLRGEELLRALEMRPFLVKPNRDELALTVGRSLTNDPEVLVAMREIHDAGAAWVVVSNGARATFVLSSEGAWRLAPPEVDAVNAIGCGDSMAGGIAWALDDGRDPLDAVRYGLAAAANNLEQLPMGRLERARIEAIAKSIQLGSELQ